MWTDYVDFFKRTAIVVAVATVPFLIWYLFDVILIVFGAIILALLLRLGAEPFMRWLAYVRDALGEKTEIPGHSS